MTGRAPLRIAPLLPSLLRPLAPLIERAGGVTALRRSYHAIPAEVSAEGFPAAALSSHDIRVTRTGGDIPAEGPLVVVANHPTGAPEGLAVMAEVLGVRRDARSLSNRILAVIPEMQPLFFAVEPGAQGVPWGVMEARRHLGQGGCLVIFPGGTVPYRREGRTEEAPWHPVAATLAQKAGAPILPIRVRAQAGWLFRALTPVSRLARTALLPRALADQRGRTIRLEVLSPVRAEGDPVVLTAALRATVLAQS